MILREHGPYLELYVASHYLLVLPRSEWGRCDFIMRDNIFDFSCVAHLLGLTLHFLRRCLKAKFLLLRTKGGFHWSASLLRSVVCKPQTTLWVSMVIVMNIFIIESRLFIFFWTRRLPFIIRGKLLHFGMRSRAKQHIRTFLRVRNYLVFYKRSVLSYGRFRTWGQEVIMGSLESD